MPTSILFTSDVSFLGMTDNFIDSGNNMAFYEEGLTINNGAVIGGGFALNFQDPSVGGVQFRLNSEYQNINALHWNGGGGPYVGRGNADGLSGATYAAIPEPATLGLLGLISGGIYFTRRFFIV